MLRGTVSKSARSAALVVGVLLAVIVFAILLATVRVRIERKATLVGPDCDVYYMIIRGATLEEIRAALMKEPEVVRTFSSQGESLLCFAAGEGRLDVVELLLELGADPNGHARGRGSSALTCATASGDAEIVRVLLQHGASPSVSEPPCGFTPKEIASQLGLSDIVELIRAAEEKQGRSEVENGESDFLQSEQ